MKFSIISRDTYCELYVNGRFYGYSNTLTDAAQKIETAKKKT